MGKLLRVLSGLVASLLLLAVLVAGGLLYWVNQDDFRERVEQQAAQALGVPVRLGAIHVDWFPVPAVALDDVALRTQPPMSVRRVEARPVWSALLARRLEVATLVVRGADVSQAGVDALLAALQRKNVGAARVPATASMGTAPDTSVDGGLTLAAMLWIPKRTVVEALTWTSARRVVTVLDAQAHLDDDGLPRDAKLKVLKGPHEGVTASVRRKSGDAAAGADQRAGGLTASPAGHWLVDVQVGGGSVIGSLSLAAPPASGTAGRLPGGDVALNGQFTTHGVEVSALTAPARPLSGRLEASTTLSAQASSLAGLVDGLRTSTRFTVDGAVLHGIDLLKAVGTVGLSRGGETRLSQLAGDVATEGRAVQLTSLVARSGVLAARGEVSISGARALSGQVVVDVTGGMAGAVAGVPLALGGTLDAPQLTLTRGAMLGAAIGTAVMPGVGTGAGARLGDRIGRGLSRFFGGEK